jgi:hypothetical protein
MEIQATPLPPDCQYVIDCAYENDDIDAGAMLALRLYGDRQEIKSIIDAAPVVDREIKRSPVQEFRRMADAIRGAVPVEVRGMLCFAELRWLERRITSLAEVFACWSYEDSTVGGALKDFKRGADIRVRRDGSPTKALARRLRSPHHIMRQIKSYKESHDLRLEAKVILDRAETVPPALIKGGFNSFQAQFAEQREEGRRRAQAFFRRDAAPQKVDRNERRRRKVVRRAVANAEAVVGREAVSAFAQGKDVEIAGETILLVVSRGLRLDSSGHGALNVAFHAPSEFGGMRLADACVYMENTPALDQLAALALHVKAGQEADIISAANLSNITAWGDGHPLIKAREKQRVEHRFAIVREHDEGGAVQFDRVPRIDGRTDREEQGRHRDRYLDTCLPTWVERLTVFTCGRRAKLLELPK